MTSIVHRLVISLILISLGSSATANLCTDQKVKVDAATLHGKPLEQFNWSELRKSKLVIIGDQHSYSDVTTMMTVASKFSDPKSKIKKCIFFEFPSSISVAEYKTTISTPTGSEGNDRYRNYYKNILNGFEERGYEPYLVDHPEYFEKDVSINERNTAIIDQTLALFETKKCEQGVLIVGVIHVAPDEKTLSSLKNEFAKKLKVTSILPLFSDDRIPLAESFAWNRVCPKYYIIPKEPIIFENTSIKDLPIFPIYSDLAVYGFFDYTILIP